MRIKGIAILVALVAVISVAGCGNKNSDETGNNVEATVTVTPEPEVESNEQVTPEPEKNVEQDVTTEVSETVIFASTRQECIDGIKQAAEAFEQGQNMIVRSDNAELMADTKKSISVLYRWLIEEGLHYNVYSEEGDGCVDFHIHQGRNLVIPVNGAEEAPAKIKEYLDGLENPAGVRFDIWCLDDNFSLDNDDLQIYLEDNRYLCEYDVIFGSRNMSKQDLYDGIHILTDGLVRETNRVYSTEELAEYIKAKENEKPGTLVVLNVYFYSDSICEANYQEIVATMCEKEGIKVRYAKFVRDGVVYLDF